MRRFEAAGRNLRHAVRTLARAPLFGFTVVATLALGIGANTAVFSAMNAVLLEPLAFPDADRLVRLRQTRGGETNESTIAAPRLEDWSRMSSAFDVISGYYVEDVSDTTGEFTERRRRGVVAPRFLDAWRVEPALGRDFTDAEHRVGGPSSVIVSDRYWQRHLFGDAGAIGRTIRIEDREYSVVGVMPASFDFPARDVDLWWPYPVDAPDALNTPENRALQWYTGIGRLKANVTIAQARADLARVQAQLGADYPTSDASLSAAIAPLKDTIVSGVRTSFWLLFGAVTVLLLVACVNVASLLLSRNDQRAQELAIRRALGASSGAIVAERLTETALLAVGGTAAGLFISVGLSNAFRALAPALPRLNEVSIEGGVLLYATLTAVAVTMLCGLVPALRSARTGHAALGPPRSAVSSRHSLQWTLVGLQVALSVTLLAGAGLLVRSSDALARVDAGFDASRVLAFRVSGSWDENYDDPDGLLQRVDGTIDALAALPGAEAAATSWTLPGAPAAAEIEFEMDGGRPDRAEPIIGAERAVSPAYFTTMQIPLVAGEVCRSLPAGIHRPGSAMDVMVNDAFARRYFPGSSVVGRRLSWESGTLTGRITGVVGDAREVGIDRRPVPTVYACDSAPSPFPWYLVRAAGDPEELAGSLRQRLKELEPLRSVYATAPLERLIGEAYAEARLRTVLLSAFAAAALLLATVGIYATLSHVVGLRRREIGLRMAIGANAGRIVRHFVLRAMRVVCVGAAGGTVLAYALSRTLSSLLYGVAPGDPLTLSCVIAGVLVVTTAAAVLPAVRAARLDPMMTLKEE